MFHPNSARRGRAGWRARRFRNSSARGPSPPPLSLPLGTVYADGSICLDILQNNWSPILDTSSILCSIQSLLSDPNPNSPANSEAARLYSESRREYEKKVMDTVAKSWEQQT